MQLVVSDIGGTHARFAIAEVQDGLVSLGESRTYRNAEFASLQTVWEAFAADNGPLPPRVAFSVAAPVGGDVIQFTNNPWSIHRALVKERLGVEAYTIVNDFGAVGHAVAKLPESDFAHLCGPDRPLPDSGVTSVCGPGTGLGIAAVLRVADHYHVIDTEGGHQDFAPLDAMEDLLLKRLRQSLTRVSVERVVAGPGIVAIYETLAEIEGRTVPKLENKAIWDLALEQGDSLALAAVDRLLMSLGSLAGDIALAHGANSAVIAGGLGLRLHQHILRSGFAQRFVAKGRYRDIMAAMPVKLITHPQPGLYGAAIAFAQEHAA